jgi:hypothetical protein
MATFDPTKLSAVIAADCSASGKGATQNNISVLSSCPDLALLRTTFRERIVQ